MDTVQSYIKENKQRYLDELFDLLRIPSVSADEKHKADVQRTAEAVAAHLKKAGLDVAEVMPTAGHPVVFGEKIIDAKLPTVLVYAHYDVQPPDSFNPRSPTLVS